ncbi:MAG TPA: hypothetical protein VK545_20445 [Streptomyces sp.]|nr:hypothetical protein [Streptomyces sp.]
MNANPEARKSALHDPVFAAEVARMRIVLDRLDTALEDEGLDQEARRRIGVRLVTDCLLSDQGRAMLREQEHLARSISVPPVFPAGERAGARRSRP